MAPKIKTTRLYRYDVLSYGQPDEELEWEHFIMNDSTFDVEGHLVREVTYNTDGEVEQVMENLLDDQHRLLEVRYSLDGEETTERKVFEYDDAGRVLKEMHVFIDGSEDVTDYQYSDSGLLLKKVTVDSDGIKESEESFEYSGDRLTREALVDGHGNLIMQTTYSFTDEGTLEQVEQIRVDEGVRERQLTFLDEKGSRMKTLKYNGKDQLVERSVFVYNEEGHLTEIQEEHQRGNSVLHFKNDEKGNNIFQEELSGNGEVMSTIERTFNEDGLLTETKVFIEGYQYRPTQNYILRYTYDFH